jgi:hypothetical protein
LFRFADNKTCTILCGASVNLGWVRSCELHFWLFGHSTLRQLDAVDGVGETATTLFGGNMVFRKHFAKCPAPAVQEPFAVNASDSNMILGDKACNKKGVY